MSAKHVLIYRLGSLGDAIVALPSLRVIAHTYPDARRCMLTNMRFSAKSAPMEQVYKNTGLIHDYIHYPINLTNPRIILSIFRRIRYFHPDILVYLTAPRGQVRILRDALFFKLCGIKKIIGLPLSKKLQCPSYVGNGMYEYEGDRLLRCLQRLNTSTVNTRSQSSYDLGLNSIKDNYTQSVLDELGTNVPFIAVSIGAKVNVKDWEDENWSVLIRKLGQTLNDWGLVMIGSSDEKERCAKLLSNWPEKHLNLCGHTNIKEAALILKKAKAFVGHDSGPMHLASAVGTRCVAIFSSRNFPGEWFPPGEHNKILYKKISCMGCRRNFCNDLKKRCILSISVDNVYDQLVSIL